MQELAEAIVRQSQLAEAEQRPEFRMQLDLAQDGSLHVRVAREQGLIHVSLGAAQEGFRETLMGNVGQLREALQNVGLELGQFSVEAQADGGRAPRQQAPLDPPRPRPSRTSGSRGAAGEPTLTAAAVGGAALNVWA
jgi:flagellar hook-length control protein FliK